jgi:hypothetical protein
MFGKTELVLQDTAGHAGRILGKSGRSGAEQHTGSRDGGTCV